MTPKIMTTSAGAIEFEIYGVGAPILIIHGSPSGIDGARAMSRFLYEDEFQTICCSRPGYLGTPLHPSNPSIDQEADLLAALLDKIGIKSVGVLAWSGGGAAAYRLAVRHPTRVSAIVAIAALSARWIAPKPSSIDKFIFGTAMGGTLVKLASRLAPGHIIHEALESEGSLRGEQLDALTKQVMADPAARQLVLDTVKTVNGAGKRKAGWENDVKNFASIDTLELSRMRCPVLLVHGDGDTDASVEYSRSAHKELPNSQLIEMEDGTHLSFYAHPDAAKVQAQARRWLLSAAE